MKHLKYIKYWITYCISHEKGMTPVCYREWLDNEYLESEE